MLDAQRGTAGECAMPEDQESHLTSQGSRSEISIPPGSVLPPERPLRTPFIKKPAVRFFTSCGLFGVVAYCFAEFLQLRGYVNVYASRLFLAVAAVALLALGALWAANLSRWKWAVGISIAIIVIGVAVSVDRITLAHAKPIQALPASSPSPSPPVSVDQLAADLAKKLGAESSHKQEPTASSHFPVSVKVHIGSDDTLTVVNEGRAGITDLEVGWGKFWFDAGSIAQKKILVSRDDYPSGNFPLRGQIGPTGSFRIDLKKLLPFEGKFSDLAPNMSGWPYPEFGLRVTFRDKQTNGKYSCYKVLSSIEHMPESWGDEVATSGLGKPIWFDDVYPAVISQMKSHYSNDGSVDFQCDH
jgi:hypothetical protein